MNEGPVIEQPEFGRHNHKNSKSVTIIAIIATTIVILACIISCSVLTYTFLMNAPW